MNERLLEFVKQAGISTTDHGRGPFIDDHVSLGDLEKFAELIVRECIKTIEYRAPGKMGEVGKGWTNGYDDGLKTGAWLLKEHFGVKE